MTSNEIKSRIKKTFGFAVRCTSTQTKNPYFSVWIRPEPSKNIMDPLVYKHTFSPEFARVCLTVIYGPGQIERPYAGNVMPNSIAMHASQWEAALAAYDALVSSALADVAARSVFPRSFESY